MNIGFLYAVTTTIFSPSNFETIKDVLSIDRENLNVQIAMMQEKDDAMLEADLKSIVLTGVKTADLSLGSLKSPTKEGLEFISKMKGHPTKESLDALGSIYQLPNGLLHSVMIKESNGNKNALSNKNAKGLFQFTSNTAKEFGLFVDGKDLRTDEWRSAEASARYLSWIFTYFHKDKSRSDIDNYRYVLAGYNAGIGNVKNGSTLKIPNFRETQDYVRLVIGYAEGKYYKVKRGDRFRSIAKEKGLSQAQLSAMNNGVSQLSLIAETYLLVDKESTEEARYIVKAGDSLYGIAKRHATSVETLKVKNALSNNMIKIGQALAIPY